MSESESEVAQSCPTLCDPMDCSLSGSSVHGIFPIHNTLPDSANSMWSHFPLKFYRIVLFFPVALIILSHIIT